MGLSVLRPTITYRQALQHLAFYAKHYPNRVTTSLEYYDANLRPLCIVSHLLEAFGADAARLVNVAQVSMPTVRVLADDYGVFYADKRTLELLSRVQHYEDEGYTWQDAITEGLK